MRIGFLGGVPKALGGGGLEGQMSRTATALQRRGHSIVHVDAMDTDFELLHAFGAEGNIQFALEHWTRRRTPLVISPIVVSSPGRSEIALRVASRIAVPATHASLRRRALLRADRLVAITAYEAAVIRRLTGGAIPIDIVPNGVELVPPGPAELHPGYVLLLGTVSERKRQREVVEAIDGRVPIVVAGAFSGAPTESRAWEAAARRPNVSWLGEVTDARRVARLLADAVAVVQCSRAEVQSLAVLEALAAGTPAIASSIPSHRELAATHPGWVHIVSEPTDVPTAIERLRACEPPAAAPIIPSWDDVAARLERAYLHILGRAE